MIVCILAVKIETKITLRTQKTIYPAPVEWNISYVNSSLCSRMKDDTWITKFERIWIKIYFVANIPRFRLISGLIWCYSQNICISFCWEDLDICECEVVMGSMGQEIKLDLWSQTLRSPNYKYIMSNLIFYDTELWQWNSNVVLETLWRNLFLCWKIATILLKFHSFRSIVNTNFPWMDIETKFPPPRPHLYKIGCEEVPKC